MAKDIIIKPIISEKAEKISGKLNQYAFLVDKGANKLEIHKAFSAMFPDVTVNGVNTMVNPGKVKVRNTKSGIIRGRVSSVKKAVITLAAGDTLDIYGSEE
ncbi:MAG: 50S ribosomal protein L23 [Saprospiraceae bacterium]|jgi:large subunit ribosomal protein L23|nr:50S ribosomal protein L23 [Saprospiraceae bacterium]MBK7223302.1 50S ribosomal protein L23 [Saprospiraceae bacterium]MBK7790160.1 50S ribosomal protein L23 [Saprospiraceae bacterium]MBK8110022.1 50S ribosomal protein L23 [Saprospiraceae bacterium]MBK8850551.1 50S ribosomal protein L23 [Saprospiraceae bacterium]